MIAYKDIEQKSEEWFAKKWAKIGGTLSKGLSVDSDTLFLDILSQSMEEFEPSESFESQDMERGNRLEPFAIEYVEKYIGRKFEPFGWLQCEENELLGISPDGMTSDFTVAVETKCFARKKHMEVLYYNQIPSENIGQALHYFTVNPKLEKLVWCAFRPETVKSFVEVLTRDSILDIGLKKKVEITQYGVKGNLIKPKIQTVPDLRTVREWVDYQLEKADRLLERIEETKKNLSF
jgi:hypothetical protein